MTLGDTYKTPSATVVEKSETEFTAPETATNVGTPAAFGSVILAQKRRVAFIKASIWSAEYVIGPPYTSQFSQYIF